MAMANTPAAPAEDTVFRVHLTNFTGPFDLLLQLIEARQLDVTEVALHAVTDEFVAYTRTLGEGGGLEKVTEFLLVAATLLDLKAARLLPHGEVDDPEDLALLHARDLLFARLLQFRAFARVADMLGGFEHHAQVGYPRTAGPDPEHLQLLPEVDIGVDVAAFAECAAVVLRPTPPATVGVAHIHTPAVSVPEQAGRILTVLRLRGAHQPLSFADLVAECTESLEVVARFLALLELYRAQAVQLHQDDPRDELLVSWTGRDGSDVVHGRDEWT